MKSKNIDWLNHFVSLVVVFLGITAGFLLQNRKEGAANRALELKYMAGFQADIEVCITDLEAAIANDSIWLEKNIWAIKQMIVSTVSPDSASKLMMNMANLSEFRAQTNTYENIINSGNLNIISGYGKKQELIKYYKQLEDFRLLENYFNNFHTNRFLPYLIENYDLISQEFVVPNAEKSANFKNIFASFFSLTQQRLQGYQQLLSKSIEIKKQLEK